MDINQEIQDPSKDGVKGLKGIKSIEALKQEGLIKDIGPTNNIEDYKVRTNKALEQGVPQQVGFAGVGDSVYDENITSITQLDNLPNTRAEFQPWYAQIGAGLAKGAILAGTTFADGMIGTVVGLGNAAKTGTFSGFWDNPFSNTMQQVNEWSEKALPNYYSDAEREEPWYDNIFTANFIGDKFLKNLGFAVGAAYSGRVNAGAMSKLMGLNKARQAFKGAVTASGETINPQQALQAYREGDMFLDGVRLTEELASDAKKLRMAEPTLKLTGAFSGALGEARIEAINNSKDWFDLHKQQLDDAQAQVADEERNSLLTEFPQLSSMSIDPDGNIISGLSPEGEAMLQERVNAKFNYDEGLQKLSEDRAKMGNIDFALNIPLLTVSDAWQFGKFYAGGYNTAKKAGNILKTVAEDGTVSYAASKPSFLRNALKMAGKGIAEGPYEEMGQSVAGKVAGYKYASELNDFYGAKIDPEAEEETIDWMKAMSTAITETYGTAEGWEEGFIGGLTGLVGIPGFRGVRDSEGRMQSPVYMQGGIKEDIQEIREQNAKDEAVVAQLNARVQSPEFLNYYQSAIRHNKYQKDMDEAAENNDNFAFKNAEHNQLISDVVMFDKAGRINDLYDIIDEAGNVREEDIDQIKQLTTNQETGTSVYDNMTNQEIIDQIQKQTKEAKESVDNYRKLSQDLRVKIGDNFDEDGLEEMTYYFSNIDNLENRFKEIFSRTQSSLRTIAADVERDIYDPEASDDLKSKGREASGNIRSLLDYNPSNLSAILNSDDNEYFLKALDSAEKSIFNRFPLLEAQGVPQDLQDLQKILDRRNDFLDKYVTYLNNPQALAAKQQKQRDNVIKEDTEKNNLKVKDKILLSTNLDEFEQALNSEPDLIKRQQMLDTLEQEGNQMAKDYKEVSMYNREVSRAINNSDTPAETKADAQQLFSRHFANSNNLQEIANPNSVELSNPENLYDESLPDNINYNKFIEAQYTALEAMSKVNNDQRFKSRFPSDYLKPAKKGVPSKNAPSKDATGDSGTATIPSVNSSAPVNGYEPPVGNITPQMVEEENVKANSNAPTPQALDNNQKGRRQYYRPSIPELHIEASKEGDFRPFNVVVAERSKLDFNDLYNYLRDHNAFSYVNEGNLKVGDELGFMIDPEFNDHTIFIIDRRNNQIVGSLDESQYSVDKYEGLAGLVEKIKKDFIEKNTSINNTDDYYLITSTYQGYSILGKLQDWSKKTGDIRKEPDGWGTKNGLTYYKQSSIGGRGGDNATIWFKNSPSQKVKDATEKSFTLSNIDEMKEVINESLISSKKFIATPTTRVSQIMVGRIPYGTEERNMGEIPNVSASSIFGIVKNGVLSTNDRISDDLITKPMDMSQKEGRMYILIPNAAGKYSPAAVRVKHFNPTEYNPEDVTINTTPLYKNIQTSIESMANSITEEDVSNAVRDLKRSLYLGDVHIDWVEGTKGNAIRFTKVQRDVNGNEIYDISNGQRLRREDTKTVFLTDPNVLYVITGDTDVRRPEGRDSADIVREITNTLQSFNLPLQVNLGMLNKGGYNQMLLNSSVLTSNITDASVKSNWFTTDYFDIQGNLQQALNPASVKSQEGRKIETPVGGLDGAIPGIRVDDGDKSYYVDLTTTTIRDDQGNTTDIVYSRLGKTLIDSAYVQSVYGDSQNGSMMIDGNVLLPDGEVFNRNTKQYLTGKEANDLKDKLSSKQRNVADSKKVIDQIAENQQKVDKDRTDGEHYFILEDDGQYHEYDRVHTRLESNWIESPKQKEALKELRVNLSKNADNVNQFNNYLRSLSKHYEVDLSSFEGNTSTRNRDTIVNIIRDKMSGTNSQRALNAGTSVDSVIRNFFTSNDMPVRPENISEQAFNDLIVSLTDIKSNIEARGETFLTNNIVLFQKYDDGSRIAGEVDILSVDSDGNFKIYDVKTSRYSFYDFVDRYGKKVNYFKNKSNSQIMSQEQYYTKQLSAYKNLFESQYHTPITTLAILPFVLNYTNDTVSQVNKEKGILLKYDPSVNVPLIGNSGSLEGGSTNSMLPIFNPTHETQNPVNTVLPEYNLEDGKVGYFIRDNKLHKGYISPIGSINGVEVYITKVPNITKGFGQESHVASNNFLAVFPNGNTFELVRNAGLAYTENEAKESIKKALSGNPQKVADISEQKTMIFDPSSKPVIVEKSIIPATINQGTNTGASSTIAKEKAINKINPKYAKKLKLRQVDSERPVWDKTKELAWLNKVLPQLNENELVQIQSGLIKVAKTGALAWGQFSDGIITLSDIAAEGTTYHEAFHAVFNLLTDADHRQSLLDEARLSYGDLSEAQLEERMAEGFREYVMSRDTQSLGTKMLNFFKDLLAKVTNWKFLQPSLIQYYRNINEGEYSNSTFKVSPLGSKSNNTSSFEALNEETKTSLENKGWTEEKWNSISQEEREQAIRCS